MVIVMAMLCCSVALAGDNPDVQAYISFDQSGAGGEVHGYQPAPYETFRAYVCYRYISGGLTTVSLRLTDVMTEYPGVFAAASFVNLLPGNLAIGDPFGDGVVMASTECLTDPVICVGYVSLTYLGGGACIELLDHLDYPRWVVDCNDPGLVDYYLLLANGVVGDACCTPGELQIAVHCEPQGGDNPSHPPTYWYDTYLGYSYAGIFRVQVFDPNPENYTNVVAPEYPEEWTFGIEEDSEGTWAVWRSGATPWLGGYARFSFDNPNDSSWGHWQFGTHHSEDFAGYPDGCGYRVHVPAAVTPVEQTTWGAIKSLYR
jgi:hypothetical protein